MITYAELQATLDATYRAIKALQASCKHPRQEVELIPFRSEGYGEQTTFHHRAYCRVCGSRWTLDE